MKYFFALTLGITTLMACDTVNEISTEKLPVVNVIESSQDSSIVSCTVADYIFEDEALTRTNLTPGPEGLSFSWNAERDRIGIFGSSVSLYCSSRITTDDEGKKASFKTDDFSLKTGVAYYAYNDCRSHIENEDNILTLDYTGQRQTGNGTYSHLGEYDFMTASATPAVDNFVDFNFNHVGTVLLVQCKIPATDTYKSISIRTSNKLFVTKGTMNLREDLGLITATENSNTMTLLLGEKNTNGVSMTKDEPFDAYFTIAPIDLSEETLTIILTSATGSTYVSTMGGRNLERGKAYKKECWYLKKMSTLYTGTDRHSESEMFRTLLRNACNFTGVPAPAVVFDGGDNTDVDRSVTDTWTAAYHQPSFRMQDVREDVAAVLSDVCDYTLLATFATHDNGNNRFPYNNYASDPQYCDNFYSGPQEQDGYYTYGITGSQMCETRDIVSDDAKDYWYQDYIYDQNGHVADEAVEVFINWITDLRNIQDHKPIVVMSHIPMNYFRGDAYAGKLWFDALNDAAKDHDIIFLWGHNHTWEELSSTHYKADVFVNYFLMPGDEIIVQGKQTEESTKNYTTEQLAFYYINAGYITWGYSSIFTFIDDNNDNKYDKVVFRKYDVDGKYTKGNKGNELVNNLKLEPYTITLTKK